MKKVVFDLKLIIDPEIAFFADIDGHAVAMYICLPNLDEVIADFHGRLSPWNIVRLLWRLKFRRPKSVRLIVLGIIVLGIRKELRTSRRYAVLSVAMYAEATRRTLSRGYTWGELGWTFENNKPVNSGIRRMNGTIYNRYHVDEKPINVGLRMGFVED